MKYLFLLCIEKLLDLALWVLRYKDEEVEAYRKASKPRDVTVRSPPHDDA